MVESLIGTVAYLALAIVVCVNLARGIGRRSE